MLRKHASKLMALFAAISAIALFTPQGAVADDDGDPPSIVARLSYIHGSVSFNPAGTDDWVSAVINRPLTTGDKLWSDKDSRAELHIDSATIRLGGTTGFSFLNLDDRVVQLRLTEGTLNFRVRQLNPEQTFEVDTPNLAFSVLRPGTYRINVNEDGDATVIVVRDGQGEITGGGSAYTVHPDEVGTFSGTDQLQADIQPFGGDDDDFDRWCADRDRRMDRSESARYVSSDVIGYEDLDDYGGWRPVPDYGTVWFPHVTVVGWAPYRYGHWVWISPWGWTWVDDEPWGFAPFHYGRWIFVRGSWGWVPCPPRRAVVGVVYVRPVYAPALVAWVGGAHWGVGIGVGGGPGVAWIPLGPREVFVPSYRVSRTYVTNVNISNTTVNNTYVTNVYNTRVTERNVTNIRYVNQGVPGAVTATSHDAFISARPVSRNLVRVDEREIAKAQVSTFDGPRATPDTRAVLGAGAETRVRPPERFAARPVVARTAPPPPAVPFAKQQEAIKANGGRPLAISEVRQMQQHDGGVSRPNIRMAPLPGPARNGQERRLDQPQNAPGNRPVQPQLDNRPGNRPGQPNVTGQPSNAGQPGNGGQPAGVQPGAVPPRPDAREGNPRSPRVYNDRPPASRPAGGGAVGSPQLEQKQQQELERLHQQQDQERQRIEQKQYQEQQKLQQKNADDRRREEVQQKQQQQLQNVERKHEQQQQKLEQKQNQERQKQEKQDRPKKEQNKPKPKEDRPSHR